RNDRYGGTGKRSMRFRFNRGHHVQFHDFWGRAYPTKWRTLNTGKMVARGGANFGLNEMMNSILWNLVGVPAPSMHWMHFRVVKTRDEVPQPTIFGNPKDAQHRGDFFGMYLAIEDYDSRFLEAHGLEDGNLYKLKSTILDGKEVQRVQGRHSVTDASDYSNYLETISRGVSGIDDEWLNTYVNYDHWNRYHVIVEAVRHFDVAPNLAEHLKNRAFYFKLGENLEANPLGRMHTLPWDSDASWGPNWNGGEDYAKRAIFSGGGRDEFLSRYRNVVRDVRSLIWQEDQINTMLDILSGRIEEFVLADRDRWRSAPRDAGTQNDGDMLEKLADMKEFAFVGGSWIGGNSPAGESRDSGISGERGRDDYLDHLGRDGGAPFPPTLTYVGADGFPVDGLVFSSSTYRNSLFSGKPFAAMEWRLAEITDASLPDHDPTEPFKWEWDATWESGELTVFQEEMAIPAEVVRSGRTYRARVRMKDVEGRTSSWSEAIEFTPTAPAELAQIQESLRITELMYHPVSATEDERTAGYSTSNFEYVELQNTGTAALDLSTLRFTKGIDFDFSEGSVTTLQPGEVIIVANNAEAFVLRYGNVATVAGSYGENDEGRLSDGGERLKLSFGGGTPVIDFSYDDGSPWPTEADGGGASLELVNLMEPGDLSSESSWSASEVGGSAGVVGGGTGPVDGDSDGDGQSDAAEAIAGTDPADSGDYLRIKRLVRAEDGRVEIGWETVEGRQYTVEFSGDLSIGSWAPVEEGIVGTGNEVSADANRDGGIGYYRVRVSQ
ncbi:MAG: CotH kinase family protein, partial [Verrucomicrobiota bacterium]